MNDILSTTYVSGISNKKISYVRVPRTNSDNSFRNSTKWVDTTIKISGSQHGGTFKSAYRVANHLIRYYKDSVLAACKKQQLPVCKEISATQFQAMLRAGGVSGTGERELKKHLSAHLGKGVCPTRRSTGMLSDGHSDVHYGSLEFAYDNKKKAEFVEWTETDINNEIVVYLQRHLTSRSIAPSEVERVQVVVGGYHGDTAFQFGASVSVEMTDARKIEFEVSVCELICRKDTAKLIEDTILQRLTNGLEVVKKVPLSIVRDKHDNIKC
jgi:hypothetical protein